MTASIHSPAASPIHAKKPVNTGLSTETGEKPPEMGGDFALLFANMMAGAQGQKLAASDDPASPAASELQAQPLGSKLNIITTTKPVMSDESLLAFAKSQGLDEKALSLIFQVKPTEAPSGAPTELEAAANLTITPTLEAASAINSLDGNADPTTTTLDEAKLKVVTLPTTLDSNTTTKLINSDAALLKASLANANPEIKAAAQPNTLQLDANSSMSWSVENVEQTKTLLNAGAPVANEVLKPLLFGLNGVRDGIIKPTTPAAVELPTAYPEKQSLAASLLFAAPEAAQFAKRLEAKMALLKAPENMFSNPKPTSLVSNPVNIEASAVILPDPILDTLVIDTELTGQELQSVLSHKQETGGENKDLSSPSASNVSQTDAEERVQQYEKISQRVAEALGQRLAAQIARGDWKVDLTLKPHNLGNIGIELKMHKGELQASFTASNSATRDLIVDGLPKLRQTLGDLGMDIAHMDVNNKQERQNGGNSTPDQQQHQGNRGSASGEIAKTVTTSTPTVAASKTGSTDGLDVLV
jgi:flagellar hook-length control protein FliK